MQLLCKDPSEQLLCWPSLVTIYCQLKETFCRYKKAEMMWHFTFCITLHCCFWKGGVALTVYSHWLWAQLLRLAVVVESMAVDMVIAQTAAVFVVESVALWMWQAVALLQLLFTAPVNINQESSATRDSSQIWHMCAVASQQYSAQLYQFTARTHNPCMCCSHYMQMCHSHNQNKQSMAAATFTATSTARAMTSHAHSHNHSYQLPQSTSVRELS